MTRSVTLWWMIAPLLVPGSLVLASDDVTPDIRYDPFNLDPAELDAIRFTRAREIDSNAIANLGARLPEDRPYDFTGITRQTEFSFKLKPKLPDFSRKGAYGLDLFDAPRLDIHSFLVAEGGNRLASFSLRDGLEYSAGVRLEQEDAQIDGTAYVSSSLLGLSYGRLGRLWYGAIDVNLEQFSTDRFGSEASDILSLDVTTGRRFGITGLDAHSPLWMLSVHGDVDMSEWENNDDLEASSDWYINPSLFWQHPGFMFSAQMQLPVEFETLDDEGKPDYRLRAVFEKHFK